MEKLLRGEEELYVGGYCQWIHGHLTLTQKALLHIVLQFLCSHTLGSCTSSVHLQVQVCSEAYPFWLLFIACLCGCHQNEVNFDL
ncbi:hypothetical protein CRYUN_Cryun12cG0056800 [Craigia yunnanensis]